MDRAAVERAVGLAGLEWAPGPDDEITGGDPLFDSPHRLAEGGAVLRLLTGAAAAELWSLRTGRRQQVVVDARHAAAELLSGRRVQVVDPDRRPDWAQIVRSASVVGIYATRDDRHVQLHGSFHDGPVVLDELALPPDAPREAIEAAVAGRDSFELEAALVAQRLCGGVVLAPAEWAEHPQAHAIAGRPAVTLTRIGDAPREPMPDGDRPTSGVRVLDLTRVLAGPTAAKVMAEHGADVLHVSAPGLEHGGPFEIDTGFGKRQTFLDMRVDEELERLRELARDADVFSQGYRLGALAARGLGPEQLAALRPGIVYVSENCYGPEGPWSVRPGWEQLAQAATGMSWREGAAVGLPPRLAPAAVNDYGTGFLAAYGALTALGRRATEGGSWHVQVSLCQTAEWYQRLGDNDAPAGPGFGGEDADAYLVERDTPGFGVVRHVPPSVWMSETPPRFDLPPSPLGTHSPEWLLR
ncbi:MAG: CoA transferase [Acidimicrobiia bacterium]